MNGDLHSEIHGKHPAEAPKSKNELSTSNPSMTTVPDLDSGAFSVCSTKKIFKYTSMLSEQPLRTTLLLEFRQ